MIPRYHGRWSITESGQEPMTVLIRWDGEHCQYQLCVLGSPKLVKRSFGRNGIRRWLKEVKAEPVDGQQPVA